MVRHTRLANRKRRVRECEAAAALLHFNKQARIEGGDNQQARIGDDVLENSTEGVDSGSEYRSQR